MISPGLWVSSGVAARSLVATALSAAALALAVGSGAIFAPRAGAFTSLVARRSRWLTVFAAAGLGRSRWFTMFAAAGLRTRGGVAVARTAVATSRRIPVTAPRDLVPSAITLRGTMAPRAFLSPFFAPAAFAGAGVAGVLTTAIPVARFPAALVPRMRPVLPLALAVMRRAAAVMTFLAAAFVRRGVTSVVTMLAVRIRIQRMVVMTVMASLVTGVVPMLVVPALAAAAIGVRAVAVIAMLPAAGMGRRVVLVMATRSLMGGRVVLVMATRSLMGAPVLPVPALPLVLSVMPAAFVARPLVRPCRAGSKHEQTTQRHGDSRVPKPAHTATPLALADWTLRLPRNSFP